MKAISEIIREDMRDPRLDPMISLTRAEVTKDLKYATVFVSIYGDDDKRQKAMDALIGGAGFIRSRVGAIMRIRVLPEIRFKLDDSIEHGAKIAQLLKKAKEEQTEPEEGGQEE